MTEITIATSYPVGTRLWAKLKGFPWWPCRVESEVGLPPNVLERKPNSVSIPVYFYGSHDFAWFSIESLKELDQHWDELSKKNKTAQFLRALKEVKSSEADSYFYDDPPARRASHHGDKRKRDSDEEEDEEHQPEVKKKPGRKRRHSEPVSKKKKEEVKEDGNEDKELTTEAYASLERSVAHDKVMKMRIKLQKFLQMKEERGDKAFDKAHACLVEVEKLPVNKDYLDHLKNTKLGKVLKKIPQLDLASDKHNIQNRVKALLSKWKTEIGSVSNDSSEKPEKSASPRKSPQKVKFESPKKPVSPKSPKKSPKKSPALAESSPKPDSPKVASPKVSSPKPASSPKVSSPKVNSPKITSPKPNSPTKSPVKAATSPSPVISKSPVKSPKVAV